MIITEKVNFQIADKAHLTDGIEMKARHKRQATVTDYSVQTAMAKFLRSSELMER